MCKSLNCGCIAAFIGIIFGIIIGVLSFFGIITAIIPVIISLIIALLVLILIAVLLSISDFRYRIPICLKRNAIGIIIASIITILAAIASFSTGLFVFNIVSSILIGIGTASFIAMLILIICWFICIIQDN